MKNESLPYARELITKALEARKNAYAPYSNFHVGAAILSESGKVYTGCNVENASFGAGICAERAAVCAAVAAGEKSFTAIAVAAGDVPVTPCGICRQFLTEFGSFPIICASASGEYQVYNLSDLMPCAFDSFKEDNNEQVVIHG